MNTMKHTFQTRDYKKLIGRYHGILQGTVYLVYALPKTSGIGTLKKKWLLSLDYCSTKHCLETVFLKRRQFLYRQKSRNMLFL